MTTPNINMIAEIANSVHAILRLSLCFGVIIGLRFRFKRFGLFFCLHQLANNANTFNFYGCYGITLDTVPVVSIHWLSL